MVPGGLSALAGAIVSAVGAEHANTLGEHAFFHLATEHRLPPDFWSVLMSSELFLTHVFLHAPSVFRKLVITRQTTDAYDLRTTNF
jgi:hypothetical protein